MVKKISILFCVVVAIVGLVFYSFFTPVKYLIESEARITSGKIASAVVLLERGLKQFPNDCAINFKLAKAYFLLGEVDTATEIVLDKKLLISLKANKEFQDFLVDLSYANKLEDNESFAQLFASKYLESTDNKLYRRLIRNNIKIGKVLPEKAVSLWESAYKEAKAKKELELMENLKALLLPKYLQLEADFREEKQYVEALEVLKKALALGRNSEVLYRQALVSYELGKVEVAQKAFEEAIQLEPENDNYKILYANLLKRLALNTIDTNKKNEYFEKIKLLLSSGEESSRKANVLRRIINLNAKYKLSNALLRVTTVGDYMYPSLSFKIKIASENLPKKYKVVFLGSNMNQLDVYEASVPYEDIGEPIEVICRNPVLEDNTIIAQVYLNDEFVREYKVEGFRTER